MSNVKRKIDGAKSETVLILNDKKVKMSAERSAQIASVLKILNESMDKLKISLMLPYIFEKAPVLKKRLSGTDYEQLFQMVEIYVKGKAATEPKLDYQLIRIIDMFHENSHIFNVLNFSKKDLNEGDLTLLNAMQVLKDVAEYRLNISALSELHKEKKIHDIYHQNEEMKKSIVAHQKQLHHQQINVRWKSAARECVIKKYEDSINSKKAANDERVRQAMLKSKSEIRQIYAASIAKQKELEEDLKFVKYTYERLLEDNLKQEKTARNEKNKLLLQLQAIIKRHDQVIGDKMRENFLLEEDLAVQQKNFEEFMTQYHEKEAEYETFVKRREEEENEMRRHKLMVFIMNRAARIIQRYFRAYLARKHFVRRKKAKGKRKRVALDLAKRK